MKPEWFNIRIAVNEMFALRSKSDVPLTLLAADVNKFNRREST